MTSGDALFERKDLTKAMAEFDRDKSGTLSQQEFSTAVSQELFLPSPPPPLPSPPPPRLASPLEMRKYGEPLTDSQAAEILTNLDVGEGSMDFDYERLATILSKK